MVRRVTHDRSPVGMRSSEYLLETEALCEMKMREREGGGRSKQSEDEQQLSFSVDRSVVGSCNDIQFSDQKYIRV